MKKYPARGMVVSGVLLSGTALLPLPVQANDLLDAYRLAQAQDQTFQAALHQRNAALQVRPQAFAELLPQLTAQAGIDRDRLHVLSSQQDAQSTLNGDGTDPIPQPASSRITNYYGNRTYSLSLSQKLFDWSAFKTLAQADEQVAQAQATFQSAEAALVVRTAQAYLTVLSAADVLRADLDAQGSYQEQLEGAQEKHRVGVSPITDVYNAQAAFDTNSANVIVDQTNLENARQALSVILGKPVNTIAPLADEIPLLPPEPASVDSWSASGATDNPDLMAALHSAEAARQQVAVYRGRHLPTLSLVGSVQRDTSHSTFGQDAIQDAVGLSLDWNVFQGGLVHSQVVQALELYKQAQATYELQRRTVDQSVHNDYLGVVSGIAAVNASRRAVASNQASTEASQVGLKVGTRNETDVLVARQALAVAQRSYYTSRYEYLISVLKLKQDVGRLSEADLAQIDNMLATAATPEVKDSPASTPR